jgi:hypothetical protein
MKVTQMIWKLSNFASIIFVVKVSPRTTIMHYDVDVKHVQGQPMKILECDLSSIRNKLCSDPLLTFLMPSTAYNEMHCIFSVIPFYIGYFDMDFLDREDMTNWSYKITIKLARELKLNKLDNYISGRLMSILYDIFYGINHVMRKIPHRHTISHDTSFFEIEPNVDDYLGMGITASRWFHIVVKATSQSLAMRVGSTNLAFRK